VISLTLKIAIIYRSKHLWSLLSENERFVFANTGNPDSSNTLRKKRGELSYSTPASKNRVAIWPFLKLIG
jgi:hypothetical protein